MSSPARSASRKILPIDKENLCSPNKVLSPSTIGYYGRPIAELDRQELISALTELARMYMESERKKNEY